MKAFRFVGSANNPVMIEDEIAKPNPGEGEVLIQVHAAGITPTEVIWYPTSHRRDGSHRDRPILSHEFSGEIAQIGDGVSGFTIGQAIYGMNDWFADGALAEYCVTQPDWIASKPKALGHASAASAPISVLTAWQGLFERAKLQAGERVLVHGGAGAVGVFAIQLARWRGAHVITTVSRQNVEFARELGADYVIDYKAKPFEQEVTDVDVVFDTVGGDTLRRSWNVLSQNGRLVSVAAEGEDTGDERAKAAFFIVEPSQRQLVEIGRMFDDGALRPIVDTVIPFSQGSRSL